MLFLCELMKSQHKKNILLAFFFAIAVAVGMFLGSLYSGSKLGGETGFLGYLFTRNTKVSNILKLVKNKYVDSVNVDSMEDLAVNQILSNLDPHTVYLAPADAQQQNESLEGGFEGIGIEYLLISDTIMVTAVRPWGPAEKAGIRLGDKIVAVNPQNTATHKISAATMLKKLRGKKGSEVQVTILRKGVKAHIVTLVRDKILVSSIDAAYPLDNKTGFIKISKFDANTAEDFLDELQKMEVAGIKNIILDLRDNGGGYLDAAIEMADQFLDKNKLIVYTQGLHQPRTYYKATDAGLFERGKLAILIDENTASASEIVAGAIQDWGRGVIIGRRSFGKGLVQQQFLFNDGSAINLTIARYFTPSGRSIQKSYKNGNIPYKNELNQRLKKGEYTSLDSNLADTTAFSSKLKYKTATGKIVYAGGGIMPDVFIPLDTLNHTPFYDAVINESLITNFVYAKLIYQIKTEQYKSLNYFIANYHIQNQQYQQFVTYCQQFKVIASAVQTQNAKPLILKNMKAILVKYYYGQQAYYRYINNSDDCVNAALKQFKM
ncbi:MAG: S41 family peptidase [Sphingobacteriales bacterium]|nr:MAG: S41 family peptidase [Sphingobacteriales bacterium]